jgi:hypothetical protein
MAPSDKLALKRERWINMKTRKAKWVGLMLMLSGTCWGMSCGASFKDAAISGMMDFTTSAVTTALEKLLPVDTLLGA